MKIGNTGLHPLSRLNIIRARLGFHVPVLSTPSDRVRPCSYPPESEGYAYIMLPMRGNFHRFKDSKDATDLFNIGKRFQNEFAGDTRAGAEDEVG
jgi:hypothetical protein